MKEWGDVGRWCPTWPDLSAQEKKTKTCPAALASTVEGGSHVLHHPLPLSFINPHMDVISSNLSGFVNDSQAERLRNYVLLAELDTRVQDVVADKVCTDKNTDSSITSKLRVLSLTLPFAACCHLSPFCRPTLD